MIYKTKCPICGKVSKLEVDDTAFMAYKAGIGKIQHMFPDLKPEEREFIQTGICTLLCVMLKKPKRIIVCEKDESRRCFIRAHYPEVLTVAPEDCLAFVQAHSDHGGADVVLEVAGAEATFRLAWECARPNAIVTVVALYDRAQTLPLPDMYGKNLTFKTGGVDGCNCAETLRLIAEGKLEHLRLHPADAVHLVLEEIRVLEVLDALAEFVTDGVHGGLHAHHAVNPCLAELRHETPVHLPVVFLQLVYILHDFRLNFIIDFAAILVILGAGFGRNGKALGDGQTDVGHFREVRALAAQELAHFAVALGEQINVLVRHSFNTPFLSSDVPKPPVWL